MNIVDENGLLSALQWRYAVKNFQRGAEIPPETWSALEAALVLTPSSYNLQPWRFIVVQDPGLKRKLRTASVNQPQVEDCSHLVVFLARRQLREDWIDRHLSRMREVAPVPEEKLLALKKAISMVVVNGPLQSEIYAWTSQQCHIALGNLLTSAALLGIDTCPLGGISAEHYDAILNVDTTQWGTAFACAVGYRSLEDPRAERPKVRFDHEDVIDRR
jgi:nitroreductase